MSIPLAIRGSCTPSWYLDCEWLWDLKACCMLYLWVSESLPARCGPMPSSMSIISSMSTSRAESSSFDSTCFVSTLWSLLFFMNFGFGCWPMEGDSPILRDWSVGWGLIGTCIMLVCSSADLFFCRNRKTGWPPLRYADFEAPIWPYVAFILSFCSWWWGWPFGACFLGEGRGSSLMLGLALAISVFEI